MSDYAYVVASNGERIRIESGDIVRFSYPVAEHETGSFLYADGEYCYIQLSLEEAGRPIVIERYRSEIIV